MTTLTPGEEVELLVAVEDQDKSESAPQWVVAEVAEVGPSWSGGTFSKQYMYAVQIHQVYPCRGSICGMYSARSR